MSATRWQRAKGPSFEASLLPLIEQFYPGSIRRGGQGRYDKGDIYMPGNDLFIVEAKCAKEMRLSGWTQEAEREALNAGVPFGLVVHKRVGKTAPEEQWATMKFGSLLRLIHRDRVTATVVGGLSSSS